MNHVAVVLAAGGSTRLGRPKQLLKRDGETLVHRAVRLALETRPTQVIVVIGAYHEDVAEAVSDLPCVTVRNEHWRRGLAGSLARAGALIPETTASVLVHGCDQPRLEAAHLKQLLIASAEGGKSCAATAYLGALGIPAVVPTRWFASADSAAGDVGFRERFAAVEAMVGRVAAAGLTDDVDTPEALNAAVAAGWLDPD